MRHVFLRFHHQVEGIYFGRRRSVTYMYVAAVFYTRISTFHVTVPLSGNCLINYGIIIVLRHLEVQNKP